MWSDRTVLVTGGAGFIGSWLSYALAERGARVVVLDVKDALLDLEGVFQKNVYERVSLVSGDVRDKDLLRKIFGMYDFGTVFHLAAEALVGETFQKPEETLDTNIRGTYTLIEVFRTQSSAHAKREIIVASSDKAYGTVGSLPYSEETELRGQDHPYDLSKHCEDRIALMYAAAYGVPVCVTRFGNVFGGGDFNYSRLIPDLLRSLHRDEPFKMRSDGSMRRDYVYIEDVVAAYRTLAEAMHAKGVSGRAYNFGNNDPQSVRDVVERVMKACGKEVKIVMTGEAKKEIKDQYLNSARARDELDWSPVFSFDEGLSRTIHWYTNHFKRTRHGN